MATVNHCEHIVDESLHQFEKTSCVSPIHHRPDYVSSESIDCAGCNDLASAETPLHSPARASSKTKGTCVFQHNNTEKAADEVSL